MGILDSPSGFGNYMGHWEVTSLAHASVSIALRYMMFKFFLTLVDSIFELPYLPNGGNVQKKFLMKLVRYFLINCIMCLVKFLRGPISKNEYQNYQKHHC